MEKKRELFIAPSIYSLLLYTIINDNWTKSDYVLSDRIPLVVHESLRKNFGCYVYSYLGFKRVGYLKRFVQANKYYLAYKKVFKNRSYEVVWGNDEFTPSYLFRNQGMTLIEDGAMNSQPKEFIREDQFKHDVFMLPFWMCWIWRNYTSYGWSKKVRKIYHTTSISLPEQIAPKGIQLDLQKTWDALSESGKTDILKLFGIEESFMQKLTTFESVLVTQILPIPDEDKIAIYKKMTEGMDMRKVLIKTHYAETTDYRGVFPESTIITMPVPMQLFALIGYNPKQVMTISSSAVAPFIKDGVDVVFLGTEIDSRIAESYGVMTKETYMASLNSK